MRVHIIQKLVSDRSFINATWRALFIYLQSSLDMPCNVLSVPVLGYLLTHSEAYDLMRRSHKVFIHCDICLLMHVIEDMGLHHMCSIHPLVFLSALFAPHNDVLDAFIALNP